MIFRNEIKHSVSEMDLIGLRKRLAIVAKRDIHAGDTGDYVVKSLYFDNCYDKALREKEAGYNKREKFRIRYYNNDTSFIRLEKKSKINNMCIKDSCMITKEQADRLIDYDIEWAENSQEQLINELRAKMSYQLLRPRSIVVYRREAYIYEYGNVRVTIDSEISGTNNLEEFFAEDIAAVRLFTPSILEVKWDRFLPQIIRDAVQLNNVRSESFSKYAATRFDAF